MTIRLNCDVDNTQELLKAILPLALRGERVMFLTNPGRAPDYLARVRVMLSRARKQREREGRRTKHFILHATTHRHTEYGKRHDAVVVWIKQTVSNSMMESLEDLLANEGNVL